MNSYYKIKKIKFLTTTLLVVFILLISFFTALFIGSAKIDIPTIFKIISDSFLNPSSEIMQTPTAKLLINIRLPRIFLALLTGANLSVAGIILQSSMRNPIADTGIIGINSGAGLFAIAIIILFPKISFLITPFAFFGAMLASILVYFLSYKDGISPSRIILAGIAVASLFGAGISTLLIFFQDRVGGALMFMSGTLSGATMGEVKAILPYTIICITIAIIYSGKMNILSLGDEKAESLGVNTSITRMILLAISSLLAASSVSIIGLLGFIGLIVPHIARMVIGNDHRLLIPFTALGGATFLLIADTLARNILRPIELPVGVIMSLCGVPFFLYLLRKNKL